MTIILNGTTGISTVGNQQLGGSITLDAGTTTQPPLDFTAGVLLTTPIAGATEFDGANTYGTNTAYEGRGIIPVTQTFKLLATQPANGAVVTGTNYFGPDSNILLAANSVYEIEIVRFYQKSTAGTVSVNLNFNSAPVIYTIRYEMSPITGIVAPPGTATMLAGQSALLTAASTVITTGSLTSAVNHYANIRMFVVTNATLDSVLRIYSYNSAGSFLPLAGSYWKATKLPATNNGSYGA